jgi:uncharacterized membrane protein
MKTAPRRATAWIAGALRWGSFLSAALMLLGTVLVLGERQRPLQVGPPMPPDFLAEQLFDANPYAIMQVGVLFLLLTPLVRLVMAAVSFWMDGERRYSLVSLGVLAIVLVSILLSQSG